MKQKTLLCLHVNSHQCYSSYVPSTSEETHFNSKETEGREGRAKVWNQLEKHEQLERYILKVYVILKATRQIYGRKIHSKSSFWLLNLRHFRLG